MGSVQRSLVGNSSRMVETDVREDDGRNEESDRRRNYSLRQLRKINYEGYQVMVDELRKVGGETLQRLIGKVYSTTRHYISDVIPYGTVGERDRLLAQLHELGRSHRGGLFHYVDDETHIHVIHDCAWSDRSCRCRFKKEIGSRSFQRNGRTNRILREFSNADWYDYFIYFVLNKLQRGTSEIWIDGEIQRLPTNCRYNFFINLDINRKIILIVQLIRWKEMCGIWEQGVVQRSHAKNRFDILEEVESDASSGGDSVRTGAEGNKRKKRSMFDTVFEKTTELLMTYPSSPPELIMQRTEFRTDMTLINPRNKIYVNAALDHFGGMIQKFSMKDFYVMYSKEKCEPVFNSSNLYYSIEDSTTYIDNLLKLQFDDNIERITEFLGTLIDILDKKIPKLNTIAIYSPPSAGKNWFFDMIFAICLAYGQFGIANKHNQFAFQDAPNQRVILWDEPNYEPAMTDFLKLVLGGGSYKVRVKSQKDTPVCRTPVVVLTNNRVDFMHQAAFADRVKTYNWKRALFLKELALKPHPLCFFQILKMYNIDF